MPIIARIIFVAAAVLEVGGDAIIRRGLRGRSALLVGAGFAVLGSYGILVNTVRWDFSKLIGVYVGVFALAGVLAGKFIFRETILASTWVGLAAIILGGLIIQFGNGR